MDRSRTDSAVSSLGGPSCDSPAMAQREPAPQFGKWESEAHYTVYFERARRPSTSGSNNRTVAPPSNANPIPTSSRTHAMQNPNLVHQKDIEAPNAADGHYPARTERQTRAEVSNLGKMTNNASQPRRETAYWGDGTRRVEYKFQHNPSRPRFGGRAGHYPTRERYYSSESGGSTGSIPPPAPRGSHLRPVVEGERTPVHRAGAPIFGEWNVNGPSADYGFTQAFGQVRDRKKTSTTPVAATEAPTTPSYNSENLNTNRRFKGTKQTVQQKWGWDRNPALSTLHLKPHFPVDDRQMRLLDECVVCRS